MSSAAASIPGQVTGRRPGKTSYPRYDGAELGLRGYWYPACFSRQLRRKPVSVELLGERIMLMRSEDGTPSALDDRCPHRGIPLSQGRREFPGCITCVYHGWTYSLETGDLVAVLTDGPDSPICGTGAVTVRTHPVREVNGLIWMYLGDGEEPPPLESQVPAELLDEGQLLDGRISTSTGDWRHAAENGFDEGHVMYLHRTSLWKLFRQLPVWSELEVEYDEDSAWMSRKPQRHHFYGDFPGVGRWPRRKPFWKAFEGKPGAGGEVMAASVSIRLPGLLRVSSKGRVSGPFAWWELWAPTKPGEFRHYQFLTKRVGAVKRVAMKAWYWLTLRWIYHHQFNGQDRWMIREMRTPPEFLYRPDRSIVMWRRLVEESLERAEAGGPAVAHEEGGAPFETERR